MLQGKRIAVIGGGKMGSAIVGGILTSQLIAADKVTIADKLPACR